MGMCLEFISKDWLVVRRFKRPQQNNDEVCILTTRSNLLARHKKEHLKYGERIGNDGGIRKVPGLRRYKTQSGAARKALKMNKIFNTNEHAAIRSDNI